MKKLFSFFAILLFSISQSQELKNFAVPKGYEKILETKGDLDKDGKDETLIVFNSDKRNNEDFNRGFQREIFIIKNNNGQLKIWKKNPTVILGSKTGFSPEYNTLPEVSIKNGVIIISQSYSTNSRHTYTYKHTYRFQNNDFYLIGSVVKFDDTCQFNRFSEINFSTGKVIVDDQYYPCFEDDKEPLEKNFHKEFKYKWKTLIKMDNFTPGETVIQIPNSKQYFIY
ncbi:hypothetical protein [Chryseobacterium turcicum]|uniref:Uncharacterized protein n=1 Tax=Chryseobacterium turcicum TaxID=2898076 RepID=A0A9Q3YWC3_9FLAO|nr:hypothetical protein [Chryseobacterium turcicum]MCD1115812.1 hypothetical protein [Chryseobacterium turcicum]